MVWGMVGLWCFRQSRTLNHQSRGTVVSSQFKSQRDIGKGGTYISFAHIDGCHMKQFLESTSCSIDVGVDGVTVAVGWLVG